MNFSIRIDSLALWGCLFTLTAPAQAQCSPFKAVRAGALCGEQAGRAVALSGSTAAIGTPFMGPAASGGVQVLDLRGAGWVESALLVPNDGQLSDQAGKSVDIDGSVIVAGAENSSPGGTLAAGSAYVFERVGGSWMQTQKLVASDKAANARFGFSVSVDGEVIAVGARVDSQVAFEAGAVYVFERIGGSWVETAKLTASDAQPFDGFGFSVAVDGDRIAVGVPGSNAAGLDTGAAYIFERGAAGWSQTTQLVLANPVSLGAYGTAVALQGNELLVGSHMDDDFVTNSGSVYAYRFDGSTWQLEQEFHSMVPTMDASFGFSIDIDGETAVIGEWGGFGLATHSGACYVFRLIAGSWTPIARFIAPDGTVNSFMGWSVGISGEHVIAGVPEDDNGDPSAPFCDMGSAWLFDMPLFAHGYCFGVGCPCGNDDPSRGCAGTDHTGALLVACGTGSVAADDAAFEASGLPPGQPALLFRAANAVAGGAGVPFGDGLRCAGGQAKRLGVRFATPQGTAAWGPALAATAGWLPGETWRLQAWYRDPLGSACGTNFNMTNGIKAQFEP